MSDEDKHQELLKKLEKINDMERGKAERIVTDILKYLMEKVSKND